MKKLTGMILGVLIFALASIAGAVDLKLGHIDLQRLMAQSDAGKEARENYFAKTKKFQDEINIRSERIKKLKDELESEAKQIKSGDKVPQSTLDKEKEYGSQTRELQRLLGGYQEELKVYDAELTRKVLEEFSPVIGAYAKNNGYDYIFRGFDAMAYASEKRDLTDELIKEFNKKRKK